MTELNTQLTGDSLNIAEQRKRELKQLFPGVFTETKNDMGEIVETLDFERLKAELGEFSEIYDNRRERYGMDWPGKRDCLRLIQTPSRATLKPCRAESVDFDTTQNLFIEGDNLEVLKLLQKSYYGQVKMIYIDPPYNTGNEFIYPDNFSESLDTYLEYAGLKETGGEGRKWSTNTANEGRFHTKWLNMMYPRLYLARNLLKDDGVIFISIDDNEVENLRRMCDEIFGEENFITSLIWQKVYSPKNSSQHFSEDHDYVLVFAKNAELWRPNLIPRDDEALSRYKNLDGDTRGPWKSSDLTARNYYGDGTYEITGPTGKIFTPSKGNYWRFSKRKFEEMCADNRIWWGPDKSAFPAQKRFLSEVKDGVVPQTLLLHKVVGHTQEAKKELIEYVDFEKTENVLNSVKPTRLIRHLVKIGTRRNQGDIVVDFFSGSAPTGHSIMDQNREDSGDRKYILVQLPEPLSSEEVCAKYISDLGKSRIKNVSKKHKSEMQNQLDLEGNQNLDLGFKVLKLDQSNFKHWQAPSKDISDQELQQQLELSLDNINPNASDEDLLYELMLKASVMPTETVEIIHLAGQPVFNVAGDYLYCYLGKTIDQALIDAVLDKRPEKFICLDAAFHNNDQLKANAVKTFATFNTGKQGMDRIEFSTV